MLVLSPKQREIKARETRILEIARQTILVDGYHGLNMDRIAEQIGASKGTVYNHFGCKEEIIIALAVQTMKKRLALFQAAAQFRGKSRFRIFALIHANVHFFQSYPDFFRFEQMLRIDSIWEKTTTQRRALIKSHEINCMGVVSGIVRDAIASGDLILPDSLSPENLVFGLWSMSWGAHSIISSNESLGDLGVKDPNACLIFHLHQLLDSFDWKPISTEFDYPTLEPRIVSEVLSNS